MMDSAQKTLIFLTLCAIVGAQRFVVINKELEVLVTVPPTHIGETEIESATFQASAGQPFLYTVRVQKNETLCINSSDPLCTSLIKAPTVDVSVTLMASDGVSYAYSDSVNGSLRLEIHVDPEFSVIPQKLEGGSDRLTVSLDILYDTDKTTRDSLSSRRRPTLFSLDSAFRTTTNTIIEDDNRTENGQSTLCCSSVSALILLALLPVLLLK